jgi:5-methylcytosine-specific restriction endonuclease McrA
VRRRKKHLQYSPEVLDLHQRLLAQIEDLNALVAKQADTIEEMLAVLDHYSRPDIPNETVHRNITVVKKARKMLFFETTCAYCNRLGGDVDPDGKQWHMDHIKPLALGGEDSLSNIVKACRYCNLVKGTREILPADGTLRADGTRYYRPRKQNAA